MEFQEKDLVKCAFFGDEVFILEKFLFGKFAFRIFRNGNGYHFVSDGRQDVTHTHPVLTLVKRPAQKIKKRFWLWAVGDKGSITSHMCDDNGLCSNGEAYHAWDSMIKIKLENCFIDVEVDTEKFK